MRKINKKIVKDLKNLIIDISEHFKMKNGERETAKLIVDDFYDKDLMKAINLFYYDFVSSVEDRISLMLPKFEKSDLLLNLLLLNKFRIKKDLEKEIIDFNKTRSCCADESTYVINKLVNLLITGEHSSLQETYNDYWERLKDEKEKERLIDFKNDKEITFWSCKKFKDTKEVMEWIINKYYKTKNE